MIEICISRNAKKDLKKVPIYIKLKLLSWIDSVEEEGLNYTRTISGYHDEPLMGDRKGQRSVRLNRSYRMIYILNERCEIKIINILEIHKHEY